MKCPADVGRRARLDLTFAARKGATVLSTGYCEAPFKITRLQDGRLRQIAQLIIMQSAPGVFGGDDWECNVTVGGGARLLITQQSATKVHPSNGRLATVRNRVRVESGGELYLINEPVIPFAHSRLRQTTLIELESGARFAHWESLMAGRIGRNESWKFEEFDSEVQVRTESGLLYLDRYRLTPARSPVTGLWTLSGALYTATGLSFGEQSSCLAERLHESLPLAGVDTPSERLAVVRMTSATGPEFHRSRDTFVSLLMDLI